MDMNNDTQYPLPEFRIGDRVSVSSRGGWKTTFPGTISRHPEPIRTLQGDEYFHWVAFDQPQACIDGDDEYVEAQVLGCYLTHLDRPSN
jgi:hypothetical protein